MHKIAVLFLFGGVVSTSAIVVQNYTVAEAPPSTAGLGLDWSYVYNYNNSSAVAVGGSWLLTAAHVADDGNGSVSADGTTYYPQETVYHSDADLALVRFDKDFLGFYPLYTGGLVDEPKLSVLLVGFGTSGSVNNFGWTDHGSGRGTKRWGTQQIDSTTTRVYDVGNVPTVNNGFLMEFYLPSTVYEAGTGVGDSGGGVFYEDGGAWKLAGIHAQRTPDGGGGYLSTFAVAMPEYAGWVSTIIPEPVTTSMLGLGMFGLFLARARKQKEMVMLNAFPFAKVYSCDRFLADSVSRPRLRLYLYEQGVLVRELVQATVLPIWNQASDRYRMMSKAFWNRMVVVHERRVIRRLQVKAELRRKALRALDAFLSRVME